MRRKKKYRNTINIFSKVWKKVKFKDLKKKELEKIKRRRKKIKIDLDNPTKDAIGMAMSGGGVRSATFNLGILQAFHKYKFFKYIDYLSTVSGGGYIGSSLSWFLADKKWKFPFKAECTNNLESQPLEWIRNRSSYLTPGDGLDFWSLVGAILRGAIINLVLLIPTIITILYFFTFEIIPDSYKISKFFKNPFNLSFPLWDEVNLYSYLFYVGMAFIIITFLKSILDPILNQLNILQLPPNINENRESSIILGRGLKFGVSFITIGLLPFIDSFIQVWMGIFFKELILSTFVFIVGVLFLVIGWKNRKGKDETKGIIAFLFRTGVFILTFLFVFKLYRIAFDLNKMQERSLLNLPIPICILLLILVFISFAISLFFNINFTSMHRYYRDRLLETYMPKFKNKGNNSYDVDFLPADKFCLTDLKINESGAPLLIINANLTTTGSKKKKYKYRGGTNFIFSPYYTGSDITGYVRTDRYNDRYDSLSLATAFSISGAAIDSNFGNTKSRPLTFLMTLFNIRLGYWLSNPKIGFFRKGIPILYFWYAFKEMFGFGLNEKQFYIHLSDGGHFENLGLYELIRRKCPYIIVSDAGADPSWIFKDLAKVCRLARVDFCAEIDIDPVSLSPDKDTGYSPKAFVLGDIKYENNSRSKVIYIKTNMPSGSLPEDLHYYKKKHPKFPDQSTIDQFFDETQFEAYRELGFRVGEMVLKNWQTSDPKDIFKKKYHKTINK